MALLITSMTLKTQNRRFAGTGGISPENRGLGFLPGFMDQETGRTYLSNVMPMAVWRQSIGWMACRTR